MCNAATNNQPQKCLLEEKSIVPKRPYIQITQRCDASSVASISALLTTFDMHQLRLAMPVDNKRRELASTDTPRIQPIGILMDVESLLSVMPVNYRRSIFRLQLVLAMIPELLPRCARMFATRYPRLEIDSPHVHDVEGVLVFEGCVGNEAGVYGYEVA
jgi:hypothetical protein